MTARFSRRRHSVCAIALTLLAGVSLSACENRRDPSVRYDALRAFLADGDFAAANNEVSEIILHVAGQTGEGTLTSESIASLPCADLVYIDALLSAASQGRFGFAAQARIINSLAEDKARPEGSASGRLSLALDAKKLVAFGDAVGWRRDGRWLKVDELTFNTDAPAGHLPVFVPEPRLRAPFKTRDDSPDQPAALIDVLVERFAACWPSVQQLSLVPASTTTPSEPAGQISSR